MEGRVRISLVKWPLSMTGYERTDGLCEGQLRNHRNSLARCFVVEVARHLCHRTLLVSR